MEGKVFYINISKSAVYDDVRRKTSYIGSKAMNENDVNSYKRIHTSVDDEAMLNVFFADSVIMVNAILFRYIIHSDSMEDGYHIVLRMNENWDERQGMQEDNIRNFFVNSILASWLNYVKKDDSQIYQAKASDIAQLLKTNVDSRIMPKKKRKERRDTCIVIEQM